jgi:hypothetical protein
MSDINHYDYLDKNFFDFLRKLGLSEDTIEGNCGIVRAHGDKGYGYRYFWEEKGIPFHKGMALYLLSYIRPFSKTCRETEKGWVDPGKWVVKKANELMYLLP